MIDKNGTVNNFCDLEAWQKANSLTLLIYQCTKDFPKEEVFGIISQMRRAASSIMANIAEGFGRFHFKDKVRFYYFARGSAAELQSFSMLSRGLDYLGHDKCQEIIDKADEIGRLLNGLINSVKKVSKPS
jgi:four helix bundle protein